MARYLDKILEAISTPNYVRNQKISEHPKIAKQFFGFSNKVEENLKQEVYDSENKISYYTDKAVLSFLDIAKYPLMKIIKLIKSDRATFKNTP